MSEHFHILMTEPEQGTPSIVMQVIKQRFACSLRHEHEYSTALQHVWQERFYDFNVWSEKKEREKLCYMHQNRLKRGFVAQRRRNGSGAVSVLTPIRNLDSFASMSRSGRSRSKRGTP
jgi:REP element-mobilizing transposase RayT